MQELYSIVPKTAPTSASAAAPHAAPVEYWKLGRIGSAPLTCEPVRFDGDELPQSWMLRKYAFTSDGGAHEESLPPKKVEKYRPPMSMFEEPRYCRASSCNPRTLL